MQNWYKIGENEFSATRYFNLRPKIPTLYVKNRLINYIFIIMINELNKLCVHAHHSIIFFQKPRKTAKPKFFYYINRGEKHETSNWNWWTKYETNMYILGNRNFVLERYCECITPHWSEFAERSSENGGIYPQALTYNKTQANAFSTHFLGMHVYIRNNGLLELSAYDKRKNFGLKIQRYPDMCSMIPRNLPYGTYVGLLHRSYRICTSLFVLFKHAPR